MTRRHKIAAIGLVGCGLLLGSLGANPEEEDLSKYDPRDYCTTDLERVFELCRAGGWWAGGRFAQERLRDAIQAGCVMNACPDQVPCTGLDRMWCTRCDNPRGALFWANDLKAGQKCAQYWGKDMPAFFRCLDAGMMELCPGWNGRWPRSAQSVEFAGLDDLGPDE